MNKADLESREQQRMITYMKSLGYFVEKVESSSAGGFPDLYCLKNGVHFLIEAKRVGVEPTPVQLYKHKQIRAHGGKVYVFDSARELKKVIKE